MASHVVVIAADLRRTTVKVSPGTYLSDVLQEACKKLSLAGDKYLIKHKQKHIDLSVPFRTSGLSAGAKLELVQKANTPSAVLLALQIPQPEAKEIPGGRLIKRFPSDLAIWQILRQFESGEASVGKNVNITARGGVAGTANGASGSVGQLYYETPVLNIMGRELASFADFQKTLSQLGHNSGNVLIRLSFRKTDQTLHEAMEQISQLFKDKEAESKDDAASQQEKTLGNKTQERIGDTSVAEQAPADPLVATGVIQQPSDGEQWPHPQTGQIPEDSSSEPQQRYQPVNVFLAPSGTTPAAALVAPIEDNDFSPSIAQAQLHQTRLQERSRNKRLPSDKEIEEKEAAEQARIAAVKSVLIKVRFPDNTSSDWQVGPSETGAFLYEAVRHVMACSDQCFRLLIPGSKTVVKDDDAPSHSLVRAYRLSGRVLMCLIWDEGVPPEVRKQPFLKASVAQKGQAVMVPELPTAVEEKSAAPLEAQKSQASREAGDGPAQKPPKWFKFGKK